MPTFSATSLGSNIRDITIDLANAATDRATFFVPLDNADSAPTAPGSIISIIQDAGEPEQIIRFTGRVVTAHRVLSAGVEGHRYTLHGPWADLERCTWISDWPYVVSWTGTAFELASQPMSRAILWVSSTGVPQTIGAFLTTVLSFASSRGCNIAGSPTISAALRIPTEEVSGISVAEIIQRALRWLPDFICRFNYNSDVPTITIGRATGSSSLSSIVSADIGPSDFGHVTGVQLVFLKRWEINGELVHAEAITQNAGDTEDFRTFASTIDLNPGVATITTQRVKTDTYPKTLTEANQVTVKTWFRDRVDGLRSLPVSQLVAVDDTFTAVVAEADLAIATEVTQVPRELIEGAVHEFMGVKTARVELSVKLRYTGDDDDFRARVFGDSDEREFTVGITATNANTQTYRNVEDLDEGEAVPSGLAAEMLASFTAASVQGTVTACAGEAPLATIGTNLTGTPFPSGGIIQTIRYDLDRAQTTVTTGPARHLGLDQIRVLQKFQRETRNGFRALEEFTGGTFRSTSSAADTKGAQVFPKNTSTPSPAPGLPAPFRVTLHRDGETIQFSVALGHVIERSPRTADPITLSTPDNILDGSNPRRFTIANGSELVVKVTESAIGEITAATLEVVTTPSENTTPEPPCDEASSTGTEGISRYTLAKLVGGLKVPILEGSHIEHYPRYPLLAADAEDGESIIQEWNPEDGQWLLKKIAPGEYGQITITGEADKILISGNGYAADLALTHPDEVDPIEILSTNDGLVTAIDTSRLEIRKFTICVSGSPEDVYFLTIPDAV